MYVFPKSKYWGRYICFNINFSVFEYTLFTRTPEFSRLDIRWKSDEVKILQIGSFCHWKNKYSLSKWFIVTPFHIYIKLTLNHTLFYRQSWLFFGGWELLCIIFLLWSVVNIRGTYLEDMFTTLETFKWRSFKIMDCILLMISGVVGTLK